MIRLNQSLLLALVGGGVALCLNHPVFAQRGSGKGGGLGGGDGAGEYFFGILHSSNPNSQLVPMADGSLNVHPLGQTDCGVRIHHSMTAPPNGESPGWTGEVHFGFSAQMTPGSHHTVRALDQFDNPIVSLTNSALPNGACAVGFESGLCPTCPVTVELFLHGQPVGSHVFQPPLPPMLVRGNIGSQGNDGVSVTVERKRVFTNQFDVDICERVAAPVLMQIMDGSPPIDADALRVSLNGLPPGTRYIGNLEMTSSGLSNGFTVLGEGLVAHELVHTVQQGSSAHMIGVGDVDSDGFPDLSIDNLGSSGQDGVSVRMGNPLINEISLPKLDTVAFRAMFGLTGSSVVHMIVNGPAQPGQPAALAGVAITSVGGNSASLAVEKCAPCGPYSITVEAIRSGRVVDRVHHDAMPSAVAMCGAPMIDGQASENTNLTCYRQSVFNDSGSQGGSIRDALVIECGNGAVAAPCTLTGSSIGQVQADRVRVMCVSLDGTVDPIESVQLLGADVSSVLIKNMRTRLHDLENTLQAMGLLARPLGGAVVIPMPDESLTVRDCDDDGDGLELDYGDYAGVCGVLTLGGGGGGGAGGSASYAIEYKAKQGSTGRTKFYDDEADGGAGPNSVGYDEYTCPTCPVQVDLLLNGVVVGTHVYPRPLPPEMVAVSFRFTKIEFDYGKDKDKKELRLPGPVTMTLTGGPSATASAMRFTTLGLPPGTPAYPISTVAFTCSPGATFSVSDAAFSGDQGSLVSKKNNGQLAGKKREVPPGFSGPDCALEVANLGSSGQDGVVFHDTDSDDDVITNIPELISATLQPVTLPAGSGMAINERWKCHCRPSFVGTPEYPTSVTINSTGGTYDVMVDFASVGAPTYSVKVSNAGATQGTVSGLSSPMAARIIASGQGVAGFTASSASSSGLPLTWSPRSNLRLSATSPILVAGQMFMGDEISITAQNPLVTNLRGCKSATLTVSGTPGGRLMILDHTLTLISACPGDVNGDDATNVADLLSVIGTWGACPAAPAVCPADVQPLGGDGQVNVADLLAVITGWGACP